MQDQELAVPRHCTNREYETVPLPKALPVFIDTAGKNAEAWSTEVISPKVTQQFISSLREMKLVFLLLFLNLLNYTSWVLIEIFFNIYSRDVALLRFLSNMLEICLSQSWSLLLFIY